MNRAQGGVLVQGHVPADRGADHGGAEVVVARFLVAEHDGVVFWHVVEDDSQRRGGQEVGGGFEEAVAEYRCVGG